MHTPRNIQSGYSAANFWTQWGSSNPRMAMCIKCTSTAAFGSAVVAFTTNSRNMTLPGHPGITFYSAPAIMPTIVEQALDEPSNLEMTGAYTSSGFSQPDVIAGKWNFASVEVFSVCWDNPNLGELLHFKGNLGEFKDYQSYFVAEGRGLIARLSQNVDVVTTRFCRAPEFGDPVFCKKDLSGYVSIGGVSYKIQQTNIPVDGSYGAEDNSVGFQTAGFVGNVPPAGFYTNGKITGISGVNAGISREIAYNDAAAGGGMTFYFKRPFPFPLIYPATFTITAGCDHTVEMCVLYGNIVNRRAEDWIPGLETVNRVPPSS